MGMKTHNYIWQTLQYLMIIPVGYPAELGFHHFQNKPFNFFNLENVFYNRRKLINLFLVLKGHT